MTDTSKHRARKQYVNKKCREDGSYKDLSYGFDINELEEEFKGNYIEVLEYTCYYLINDKLYKTDGWRIKPVARRTKHAKECEEVLRRTAATTIQDALSEQFTALLSV